MNVFLCHSHADSPFVERLRAALEREGIVAWTPDEIAPGTSWVEAIRNGIRDAQAIIPILSPNSTASQAVSSELALALSDRWKGQDKPIIPVLALETSQISPFLREYQWVDMSSEALFEKNVNTLADAIKKNVSGDHDTPSKREFKSQIEVIAANRQLLDVEKSIHHERARTANRTARTLVLLLVLSLPAYIIALYFVEGLKMSSVFSTWVGVLSSLLAAVIGYVFGRASKRDFLESSDAKASTLPQKEVSHGK